MFSDKPKREEVIQMRECLICGKPTEFNLDFCQICFQKPILSLAEAYQKGLKAKKEALQGPERSPEGVTDKGPLRPMPIKPKTITGGGVSQGGKRGRRKR